MGSRWLGAGAARWTVSSEQGRVKMGQYTDKSNRRVRWALILANSLSLVGCLLLVIIGIWTLADKTFLSGLLTDRLYVSCAYIQLAAGILCLANSLFGGYAAFREVGENMRAQLVRDLHNYDPRVEASSLVASWDSTQQRLHCCGLKTPQVELAWQSWGHISVVNPRMEGMAQMRVPASCCKGPSTCVVNGTTVVEEVWEGDCYLMGREFLENHSRVMAGTTLTVAVTMVLGGLLAVLLFRRVR